VGAHVTSLAKLKSLSSLFHTSSSPSARVTEEEEEKEEEPAVAALALTTLWACNAATASAMKSWVSPTPISSGSTAVFSMKPSARPLSHRAWKEGASGGSADAREANTRHSQSLLMKSSVLLPYRRSTTLLSDELGLLSKHSALVMPPVSDDTFTSS